MQKELSPKQKLLLQIIRDYRRKHGTSPSLNDLKKALGVPFVNSVVHLLEKLEEKQYLTRTSGTERGIILIENFHQTINVPIVGAVACGQPLLAKQNIEGYIPVDKDLLLGNPSDYFFLRAVGDSMNNTNVNGNSIEDGDFVLIKTQSTANMNEKIVALIDDEATIKVYKRQEDFIALVPQSTNPANKPIILHSDFIIQGIVKAVFKKEMLVA
jgi:repressor LexA